MPDILDLDTVPVNDKFLDPIKPREETGIGDYGRAAAAGAYGVVSGIASGIDYLADTEEGSTLKGVRKFAEEGAKSQVSKMSEGAREALNAGFLPGGEGKSIWDDGVSVSNSLGLKVVNAAPSLLASILPGGLAAGVARAALARAGVAGASAAGAAIGTGAGGAVSGTMGMGQVFDDIENGIMDAKEEDLREGSAMYAKLREDGYSDTVSRKVLVEAAAGNKPAIAGAVTALLERVGAGGMVAKKAAGVAAEEGIRKGIAKGFVHEGAQETVQGLAQEGITQQGTMEAGIQDDFNWHKFLDTGAQSAVIGGALGGAVGGATAKRSGGRDSKPAVDIDPVVEAAATVQGAGANADDTVTSRGKVEAGLAEADRAIKTIGSRLEDRQAPDAPMQNADIAEAINADRPMSKVDVADQITMANTSDFVAQDEYEADPDAQPGQPVAPEPQTEPQEATDASLATENAQQPTQDGQEAPSAENQAPTQPETVPAAGGPSEATEPAIVDTVNLDDYPPLPTQEQPEVLRVLDERDAQDAGRTPAPRILKTEAAPKQAPGVQKSSGRLTQAEANRIAAGEGDPVTLSHDPADWKGENDKRAVIRLVDAFKAKSDKDGTPMPDWAAKALETRGKTNGGGERAKAMRAQYAEARQMLSDQTLNKVNEGVARRETSAEAEARRIFEKRRTDALVVQDILNQVPLSKAASNGSPKAVREHAQLVLDVAKKAKIEVPKGTQDPHLLYLANAKAIVDGAGGSAILQFVADDYFLRAGDGEQLVNRRKVEAAKTGPSYDESERVSQREVPEGTDRAEQYDAVGATGETSAPVSEETEAGGIEPQAARVEPDRRTDGPDDAGPVVVAGTDRAGKFQVEARGRRRASPPKVAPKPVTTRGNPTEAQKEAGNYKMGHTRVAGLDISIETAKGATRSGTDANGRKWSVKMPADYGYVRGTKGVDGDHVDVYLGPKDPETAPVFVVNQNNLDGTFDEHKAMLGFATEAEARAAYVAGFSDGKGDQRIGSIVPQTMEEFKAWSKNPKGPAKPITEQRPAALRAKEATDLADLEQFFNSTVEENYDPNDGVSRVTSPRTGTAVRSVFDTDLKNLLRKVDHAQVGGITAQVNAFMSRRLRDMVGDVPVRIVSDADMASLVADLAGKDGFPAKVAGYYEPSTREIVLAEGSMDSDAAASHLLIHEGMHAAFMDLLNSNSTARRMVEDAMDIVRRARPQEAAELYGMLNPHEFVSEAFSSQQFQNFLATIPAPAAYQTLRLGNVWQMFVSGVRKFLGLGQATYTMMDASLRIGAALVDLRTAHMDVPSTPRATVMPAALNANVQTEIRDALADRGASTAGKIRRAAMRAQTFDQLRQAYKGMFPDNEGGSYLDRVVKNLQRMAPFSSAQQRKGTEFAERFTELRRKNRAVADASAELRIDATMANVNLLSGNPTEDAVKKANQHLFGADPDKSDISAAWQGKAHVFDLQNRFNKLPADVQAAMLEEAAYYKEMQATISAKLVQNILDYFGGNMTTEFRDEVTKKTLAGTLTEEDREKIGNNTFYTALKAAKELKTSKGMYFPLMRHGKYVVRTRDTVPDTMGGTLVEPNVVEFRKAKDKDARKEAEAFAKKTGLTVQRVVKRYYDPQTGEAIKAVDADASSEVGYRVTVQTEGVHFFDTETEANRFKRMALRERAEGAAGHHAFVGGVEVREDIEARGDLSGSQLASLVKSINQRDDIPAEQRKMMATAIGQAAVRMMSGNRLQQRSLPRRRVQGASAQYGRNALAYATAASGYRAKLEFMPAIRDDLAAMREQARARFGQEDNVRHAVYQEVENRINANDVGINQPSQFVKDLFAVSMLTKLFSPAHSLINATQPLMVTYPVLAGEHGQTRAALAISRAFRDVGVVGQFYSGGKNTAKAVAGWMKTTIDTDDVAGSIRAKLLKQPDGKALGRLLDELRDRGAHNDEAQFELAASVAAGRGVGGTALAKMDRIFRQAPAAVEAVNRVVSAVAAYRVAVEKGMGEAKAIDYAYDVVMNTQGDYSAANASPLFNKPALRPFLQFKKYGQAMTSLYVTMIYKAFKNASPGDRAVALKQLGTGMAMQTLMAGGLSVFGLEFAKAGFVLAAMLGLGEGWEEQERKIKRAADDAVGETWSELLRKGVVSRALGIDLSSRMSLADMWTFGEPKKYKSPEISAWLFEQMLGAPGGTMASMREGIVAAGEGDVLKAATKLAPVKVLADIAKAVDAGMDGSLSVPGAVTQAIGIRPASLANKSDARAERIDTSAREKDAQNALRSRFINARSSGELLKVRAEVVKYNKTAKPGRKLSIKSMERMREENRKERLK